MCDGNVGLLVYLFEARDIGEFKGAVLVDVVDKRLKG